MTWALGSFSRSVLGSAYQGWLQRAVGVASGAGSEFALRASSLHGRRVLVSTEWWRRGLSRGTPFVGSAGNGGALPRPALGHRLKTFARLALTPRCTRRSLGLVGGRVRGRRSASARERESLAWHRQRFAIRLRCDFGAVLYRSALRGSVTVPAVAPQRKRFG